MSQAGANVTAWVCKHSEDINRMLEWCVHLLHSNLQCLLVTVTWLCA